MTILKLYETSQYDVKNPVVQDVVYDGFRGVLQIILLSHECPLSSTPNAHPIPFDIPRGETFSSHMAQLVT